MLTQENTNYIGIELHRALYQAVIRNDIKSSQYLLTNGANANYTNNTKDHLTPLHWVSTSPEGEILCRLLLDYGANPNWIDIEGRTPLHYAANWGNHNIVKLLLSNIDSININAFDLFNGTPLYYAAREGHLKIVKQLIAKGSNVNPVYSIYSLRRLTQWLDNTDIIRNTPLTEAAQNDHTDIIQCLVQAGADNDAQGAYHNTALHYAVLHQNIAVISLLIQNGANTVIKNADGHTPKAMAILEQKEKVLSYLSNNLRKQLGWSHPLSYDAANLFILLTGENRLSLLILSQMHRTPTHLPNVSTYPNHFFCQIVPTFCKPYQTTYQTNTKYLPAEIWQLITAFWLQATLSLDMPFDKLHAITGSLFDHMDDFMPRKLYLRTL